MPFAWSTSSAERSRAWLPLFMRTDPEREIQAEIDQTRATLAAVVSAATSRRRLNAERKLESMTTSDYAHLPRAARLEIEAIYGLDGNAELRNFDADSHDELAA